MLLILMNSCRFKYAGLETGQEKGQQNSVCMTQLVHVGQTDQNTQQNNQLGNRFCRMDLGFVTDMRHHCGTLPYILSFAQVKVGVWARLAGRNQNTIKQFKVHHV